eukprot:scaffold1650_cov351-Prasinococcus_capsulatus_cf.AAC.4
MKCSRTSLALPQPGRLVGRQCLGVGRQRLLEPLLRNAHHALCAKCAREVHCLLQPQGLIDVQRLLHECQCLVVPTQPQVQVRQPVERISALRALPPNGGRVYFQRLRL